MDWSQTVKVLITGASGFIAQHVAQAALVVGHDVTGLARPTSNTSTWNALGGATVLGDIRDQASLVRAMAGMDVVFHLAGLTRAIYPSELHHVNVDGTCNVAAACVEAGVPSMVHVSSLAAAGPSHRGKPRQESDQPIPVSNYGRSKLASEHEVAKFADRLNITIVRPPIVFGEGDPATLQMFRGIRRSRIHAVPGAFQRRFSVIHAADLARLLIDVADAGERLASPDAASNQYGYGIYFADVGWLYTYSDLGKRMAKAMNLKCLVVPVAKPALFAAGASADLVARITGRAMYLSRDKVREAAARGEWICDGAKVRKQFQLEPSVSLDERLAQTAAWYQQHGWL